MVMIQVVTVVLVYLLLAVFSGYVLNRLFQKWDSKYTYCPEDIGFLAIGWPISLLCLLALGLPYLPGLLLGLLLRRPAKPSKEGETW